MNDFFHNEYHSHRWLSYSLSKPCRRNSNVIVVDYHLKLVEGVHTFRLDPTMLNLEVCSFTFIHLKVPTQSAYYLSIQWWLIKDKMLLGSLLKKMRCKCWMEITDLCKRGVSQSNSGSYSLRGGRRYHIHSLEDAYSIS